MNRGTRIVISNQANLDAKLAGHLGTFVCYDDEEMAVVELDRGHAQAGKTVKVYPDSIEPLDERLPVFVYGTLRAGHGNNRLLEGSTCTGTARIRGGYTMRSLGGFPAISPGETDGACPRIVGEVYLVDQATLHCLDRLEGFPRFYKRAWVDLENGSTAMAYYLTAEDNEWHPVVESGDWNEERAA